MNCPLCQGVLLNGLCLKCGHNTRGDYHCEKCGIRTGDASICGRCQTAYFAKIPAGLDALKAFDDVDTRKEVFRLLDIIGEEKRKEFLLWCVRQVNQGEGSIVVDEFPVNSIGYLLDICVMVMQYGLSPRMVLEELEQFGRRKKL